MTHHQLIILFVALCCICYTLYTWWKLKEFPESVSSFVRVSKDWIWMLFIWMIGFFTAPGILDLLPDKLSIIGMTYMTSLLFVGAVPLVMNDKEIDPKLYKFHCLMGIIACVASQMAVAIIDWRWLFVWVLWGLSFFDYMKTKKTMLSEMICGANVLGMLYLNW